MFASFPLPDTFTGVWKACPSLSKRLFLFLFFFFVFFAPLLAQTGNAAAFVGILNDRGRFNPAWVNPSDLYVGVPVLSGLSAKVDNNFLSWNSAVIRTEGDSLLLNVPGVLDKVRGGYARVRVEAEVELLHVGWRKRQNYFQIGLSAYAGMQLVLSKESLSFLLQGPGPQTGKHRLDGNRLDFDAYASLYFSYARKLSRRLRVGGRFKLLQGLWNVHVPDLQLSYDAKPSLDGDLPVLGSVRVQGLAWTNLPLDNALQLGKIRFYPFRNMGAALDMGLSYDFKEDWNFSAAVLNLGFLVWGDPSAKEFKSDKSYETFRYEGINTGYLNEEEGDWAKDLVRSIWDTAGFACSDSGAYVRVLPPRFNLALSYTMDERHCFGLLFQAEIYNRYFAPELGISYTFTPCEHFALAFSNTFSRGHWLNLGIFAVARFGPVQLHLGVDRLNAERVGDMQTAQLDFGLNLIFDRKTKGWNADVW